jgi:hypothetical protein
MNNNKRWGILIISIEQWCKSLLLLLKTPFSIASNYLLTGVDLAVQSTIINHKSFKIKVKL